MKNLCVLFIILCFTQTFHSALAQNENSIDVQNLVNIISKVTNESKQIIENVSTRLPQIIKELELSITETIKKAKDNSKIDEVQEEISKLSSQERTGCSDGANKKLDKLRSRIANNIEKCLNEAKSHSENIKTKVQSLMGEANILAQDINNRFKVCMHSHGEDTLKLYECLNEEIDGIMKLMGEMKANFKEAMVVTEKLCNETSASLENCVNDARSKTNREAEKIAIGVRNCKNEL